MRPRPSSDSDCPPAVDLLDALCHILLSTSLMLYFFSKLQVVAVFRASVEELAPTLCSIAIFRPLDPEPFSFQDTASSHPSIRTAVLPPRNPASRRFGTVPSARLFLSQSPTRWCRRSTLSGPSEVAKVAIREMAGMTRYSRHPSRNVQRRRSIYLRTHGEAAGSWIGSPIFGLKVLRRTDCRRVIESGDSKSVLCDSALVAGGDRRRGALICRM